MCHGEIAVVISTGESPVSVNSSTQALGSVYDGRRKRFQFCFIRQPEFSLRVVSFHRKTMVQMVYGQRTDDSGEHQKAVDRLKDG